jgi:hypothetical protein
VKVLLSHPIPPVGLGDKAVIANAGSGATASFLKKNHIFYHPFIDLGMGILK